MLILKTQESVRFAIQKLNPFTLIIILIKAFARTALGCTKITPTISARKVAVVMDDFSLFME